mgnify:CR=1 FL=1
MEYLLSLNPFIIVLIVATFNWLMTFFGASLVLFVRKASQNSFVLLLAVLLELWLLLHFFHYYFQQKTA